MKPRTETSPDGTLTLVVRDLGGGDWGIGFTVGPWHTHPRCIRPFKADPPPGDPRTPTEFAVDNYIECVLTDRSVIVICEPPTGSDRTVPEPSVADPDVDFVCCNPPTRDGFLNESIAMDETYAETGERITYRLWSGTILHEFTK